MGGAFTGIGQINEAAARSAEKKVVAIAAAQDHEVLTFAQEARTLGLCDFVLIGQAAKIAAILSELGESAENWRIADEPGDSAAAALAVRMVRQGDAHIPMKGILHTSAFMRAVLNKEEGLVLPGGHISAVTVAEVAFENRLLLVTDPVMTIAPDYDAKVKIVKNAVGLAHVLGIDNPKVALLTPVEVVNPAMPSTLDAALVSKAWERGQISGCVVDGPLALDVALSEEAARIKGIRRAFEGVADILVVPDINAGNILDKSLRYLSRFEVASALMGTKSPVVATSRSDTAQTKLNTLSLAVVCAGSKQ